MGILAVVLSIYVIRNSTYSSIHGDIEDKFDDDDLDRRRNAYLRPPHCCHSFFFFFLYSVVFQVSTILDKPMDLEGFMGLNIVVLSTEKYYLISPLLIEYTMLV